MILKDIHSLEVFSQRAPRFHLSSLQESWQLPDLHKRGGRFLNLHENAYVFGLISCKKAGRGLDQQSFINSNKIMDIRLLSPSKKRIPPNKLRQIADRPRMKTVHLLFYTKSWPQHPLFSCKHSRSSCRKTQSAARQSDQWRGLYSLPRARYKKTAESPVSQGSAAS